jgi:cytochrome c nitrite reductase small subunit
MEATATGGRAAVILSVALGLLAGLGLYTADYAEATSYMSNDPKACVNCHVMRDEYDAWLKGPHHNQTCNDCHVPQDVLGKYLTKAEHGYRHSKGFTFQDFHEPIRITEASLDVVQSNCVRCHSGIVGGIGAAHAKGADAAETSGGCVHCHAGVGHGPVR